VDVGRQALLPRDRGKQPAQRLVLLRVERRGELSFVLPCELRKLAHQPFSGRGKVKGAQPAIVGIAAPLDVAALLELVDVDDDAAGQHAQLNAESLLAAAGLGGDGAQDSRVRRTQVDGGHLFGELRCGVMAELGQQEGHAVRALAGPG
jgi:hypothetical protein